ncbi:MAG: methyltransferase domain-containing protein [Candidatus Anstonellales archaeon]
MDAKEVYKLHMGNVNYRFFGSGIAHYSKFLGIKVEEVIRERMHKKERVSILDIGTGNGLFLKEIEERFKKVDAYGITLKMDGKPKSKKIIISNCGECIPFKEGCFDFVFSVMTAVYIPDITNLLLETRRVISNDGTAYIHLGGICDSRVKIQSGSNSEYVNIDLFLSMCNIGCIRTSQRIVSTVYRQDITICIYKNTMIPELRHLESKFEGYDWSNYFIPTGRYL